MELSRPTMSFLLLQEHSTFQNLRTSYRSFRDAFQSELNLTILRKTILSGFSQNPRMRSLSNTRHCSKRKEWKLRLLMTQLKKSQAPHLTLIPKLKISVHEDC